MVNLIIETDNYQVFDVKYGVVLIDRNADTDNEEKTYKNVFMQGDDSVNFIQEIENLINAKTKNEFVNYFLSGYDDVMSTYSTKKELSEIGITVREKRKIKSKNKYKY